MGNSQATERPGPSARTPRMLLCNAGFYGTLAAVRSLGRAGVPFTTIDPSALAPAGHSRYVQQRLRCPTFESTDEWAEWLLRLAKTEHGSAIYATSDDVS